MHAVSLDDRQGSVLQKIALITGVTGQHGHYLAEFVLKKGMSCMALNARRASTTPITATRPWITTSDAR
jgi:GDP-D-mannose dehydratase